jgi:hypothetical protein
MARLSDPDRRSSVHFTIYFLVPSTAIPAYKHSRSSIPIPFFYTKTSHFTLYNIVSTALHGSLFISRERSFIPRLEDTFVIRKQTGSNVYIWPRIPHAEPAMMTTEYY